MEGVLEGMGANLLTASSGHEALALVLKHEFAMVLLDVQMPDMDGFETAELMRGMKQTRHLPIVFVTAISKEDEHIFRGYDAGAIDYLFKPVNPVILRSKVEIFLKIHRQQRLLEKKTMELDQKVEELLVLKAQLEEANQQLEELSRTDALTGLANRRHFKEVLAAEWRRAQRNGQFLALIMAAALRSPLMRTSDLAARFGGEEFVILLPGTDLEGGTFIAEAIRRDVERLAIPHADSSTGGLVTMSFGVAAVKPYDDLVDLNLVCAADKALYMAKEEGKNRCVAVTLEEGGMDNDCSPDSQE